MKVHFMSSLPISKLLFTFLVLFAAGQLWSQSVDDYVNATEKLRRNGVLTQKSSVDKTFAGAVTAYYEHDSLVVISSLTDAEAAGTETLYFFKDGILVKAFIMAATFDSNAEWTAYYFMHKTLDRCYTCHGKKHCRVTEITFGDNPLILVTENKKKHQLSQEERDKLISTLMKTSKELKALAKEL